MGKRYFKPYRNEHDSVKEAVVKRPKKYKVDPKIPMQILFHYPPAPPSILSYDPKSFPKNVSQRNED